MNKVFIPYEPALALKELGFDEPCLAYWEEGLKSPTRWDWNIELRNSTNEEEEVICTAPLYQQAFKWFREKHSLHANINTSADSLSGEGFTPNGKYGGTIDDVTIGKEMFNTDTVCLIETSNSYEEAELACIRKLIEIVKNK